VRGIGTTPFVPSRETGRCRTDFHAIEQFTDTLSEQKVSWLVTGIRKDAWAATNRITVEEDKPDAEKGYFLHPNLYGQSEEKRLDRVGEPEGKRPLPPQEPAENPGPTVPVHQVPPLPLLEKK
jgi:hypothetical protein